MALFNQTHQQHQQRQHSSDQQQQQQQQPLDSQQQQQQQQPLDSQQQQHFRHQRNLSITSQTSSHSISHHPLPILSSPALSFASVPNNNNNHDSTYVDEPLPMEGDFASLDLHSTSNQTLNNFLQQQQQQQNNQQSSSSQYPQRYDTLTWAREHALPELRQETMLATGGLHPKTSSVSSINGFLDNQASSHPQHVNFPQSNPSTDRSICSSSSPSLGSRTSFSINDLNNRPISPSQVNSLSSPFLNSSGCPSPALSAFGSNDLLMDPPTTASSSNIPSIDINESLVASMNNTSNPAPSPHLRLDMNHPAMSNGPTISLTSATPLTAKPNHQTVDVPNFQRFLNQLSQPQSNQSNINPNDPNQLTSFQQSFGQIPNLDFLHLDQNFLSTKTNKGRQRSKSESVANSIQTTNSNSNSNPNSFSVLNLNYNPYQSNHNTNPSSQTQDESQGSNDSNAFLSNHSSQPFPSSQFNLLSPALNFPAPPPPTLEDLNLGLESRNGMGGTSFETGFLQTNPNPNPNPNQSPSSSHLIHRRGRSESQIMNHFNNQANNGNLEISEPKIEEWEDVITRERSYSHSSMGSSIQSKSYQISSRTTPATKAAAAKRRKEGTEARYVCEMCGETFTRRYNLRGHQRAHKGEKPFACGFPGCTSSFARAHDQKRHYKLHLGIKDYNCKVCGKAFIRLDALQRHHKSDAGQGCYYELKSKGELSYEHDSQPPPQASGSGTGTGMGIINPSFEFCSNVLGS